MRVGLLPLQGGNPIQSRYARNKEVVTTSQEVERFNAVYPASDRLSGNRECGPVAVLQSGHRVTFDFRSGRFAYLKPIGVSARLFGLPA